MRNDPNPPTSWLPGMMIWLMGIVAFGVLTIFAPFLGFILVPVPIVWLLLRQPKVRL
jgi:hypothetical protein